MSEDFYIGYASRAPVRLGTWVRRVVVVLFAVSVAIAVVLAFSQSRLPDKVFEWNQPTTVVGTIETTPVPVLRVRRPGLHDGQSPWSRYLLVAPGKHGAAPLVAEFDGKLVELQGSLVYREDQTMIEVVGGTLRAVEGAETTQPGELRDLGIHTLVGEIVDSKCYLGVMAPGHTKPHRACATRCIAGGIPPVLLVRQAEGRAVYLLLVSSSGGTVNQEVLSMVAEPIEITGRVMRQGDLMFLRADPATYRRLDR